MERAKMVLDFAREEIKVHGKYIKVKKMRSGHYAMPLSMWLNLGSEVVIFSATVKEKNSDKAIACKLHRQFAHPTRKTLIRLINNAGIKDSNLEKEVDNVSNKCITCIKYRKSFNRPVVCMPLASEFNEMIGIDLKVWGK